MVGMTVGTLHMQPEERNKGKLGEMNEEKGCNKKYDDV